MQTLAAVNSENKVRFDMRDPNAWYVVVADGKTMWRANPNTREFIRTSIDGTLLETKGGGREAEGAIQRLKFAISSYDRLDERLKSATFIREESVELDGMPVDCSVVQAEYNAPPGSIGIKSVTRTYWIDKQRLLILREDIVTTGNLSPMAPFLGMETRHSIRYKVASIDEPVPDSLFTYIPPRNFREVDKLEPAFPRPSRELVGTVAPDLSLPTYRPCAARSCFWISGLPGVVHAESRWLCSPSFTLSSRIRASCWLALTMTEVRCRAPAGVAQLVRWKRAQRQR